MFRLWVFIGTIAFLLAACSSGKTAFNRGKFDLAVKKASQRLNQGVGLSKRGHTIASLVIKQAFIKAYEQHQTTIRRLTAPTNTEAFRREAVYKEYTALQTLTDEAQRGLAHRGFDQREFDDANWLASYPISYADRQRDTRELAAADRYETAEQAFAYRQENRLAAKDAYLNYQKALDWVPDYQQANARAAEALPFAILRVVVEPLSPTSEISHSDNQQLQRLILRQIGPNTTPSKFVRLYPSDELADESNQSAEIRLSDRSGDGYPIHQAVQMVVSDYTPYREKNTSSSTTVYSAQEYKVGEKKINDSTKVDSKEKVKGTLTTYVREIYAGLDLRMRAIDTQTGNILWEESVGESRHWQTQWQTFSGDERALNGQSLQTADLFPPSRWRLFDSMQDELASDVARRLRTKYASD